MNYAYTAISAERRQAAKHRGGLRARLLHSHLLAAACGLLMLVIALGVFIWQRRNAVQLADVRGPAARASALALGGVHESLASLRAWILLADQRFAEQRKFAWESDIEPAMVKLQSLSSNWRDADDIALLGAAGERLEALRRAQAKIEQIAHTPENEPARLLVTDKIRPLVGRIFQACTDMIDIEKGFPAGSRRKMLLATMADLRASFARSAVHLESFLISAAPEESAGHEREVQLAKRNLASLAASGELLSASQYERVLLLNSELAQYAQDAGQAIATRKTDQWNTAIFLLASEAEPAARDVVATLRELSASQAAKMAAAARTARTVSDLAVACSLGMIGLTALATWFFSSRSANRITQPVAALAQATEDLAAGKATATLAVTSRDEIGRLTDSFNQMNVALRHSQQALEASERRTRTIIESAPNGMIVVDREGDIQLVNSEIETLFGFSRDQLLNHKIEILVPESVRPDHVGYRDGFFANPTARPMAEGSELTGRRSDGTEFPVQIGLNPLQTDSGPCVVASVVDMTETKRAADQLQQQAAELAVANAQLHQSNKDLDDFAYIASHDLKEPLRGISNYASFLLEDYQDQMDADGQDKLQTLQRLCKRLESFIDSLLQFSRLGRAELAVGDVDLNTVVEEVLDSLTISLEQENFSVRVTTSLPTIKCDGVRVREIFRNLISNAMKYNDKADKWIEISCRPAQGTADGPPPGTPVFCVRDNGIGIPEKHQDSVFRIFKRLHGRDKFGGGTGSGLTIVKKIVERHGGRIWLESTVGEGTSFYFTLE
ncbi:MAG: ATP-binding protein [Planctomycetota bacterium]|nr:ATP-binding protein [Planctomycetota bacterium]